MGVALAGSAARVVGGIGMVACAAIVALTIGGGDLLGGLGGVFGSRGASLQVARSGAAGAGDLVAAPSVAGHQRPAARIGTGAKPVTRRHARPLPGPVPQPQRPQPGGPAPGPVPAPQPSVPIPPPPPAPAPLPSPGHGQVITTVGNVVKQVVTQAPPQTQPLTQPLENTIDTVVETCQGMPICP